MQSRVRGCHSQMSLWTAFLQNWARFGALAKEHRDIWPRTHSEKHATVSSSQWRPICTNCAASPAQLWFSSGPPTLWKPPGFGPCHWLQSSKQKSHTCFPAPLTDEIRPVSSCPPQRIGPAIPAVSSVWFKLHIYHVTGQGHHPFCCPKVQDFENCQIFSRYVVWDLFVLIILGEDSNNVLIFLLYSYILE